MKKVTEISTKVSDDKIDYSFGFNNGIGTISDIKCGDNHIYKLFFGGKIAIWGNDDVMDSEFSIDNDNDLELINGLKEAYSNIKGIDSIPYYEDLYDDDMENDEAYIDSAIRMMSDDQSVDDDDLLIENANPTLNRVTFEFTVNDVKATLYMDTEHDIPEIKLTYMNKVFIGNSDIQTSDFSLEDDIDLIVVIYANNLLKSLLNKDIDIVEFKEELDDDINNKKCK